MEKDAATGCQDDPACQYRLLSHSTTILKLRGLPGLRLCISFRPGVVVNFTDCAANAGNADNSEEGASGEWRTGESVISCSNVR